MTHDEAKMILLLYRTPADAEDPQIAEALALAKVDAELSRWLVEHCARQEMLRTQFRKIAVPADLQEKILAAANQKNVPADNDCKIVFLRPAFSFAAAAALVAVLTLSALWFQQYRGKSEFSLYQNQMIGVALRGYGMDLATNNPAAVRTYLARKGAPSDFALPSGLQKMAVTGCAIESWNNAKVSMICFHTGKSSEQNDLWLFVMERGEFKNLPATTSPKFAKVNRLTTAAWTQGDKLYLLGTEADEETIRKLL